MLRLDQLDRSYSPETVAVMTAAFDKVSQSVSKTMNGNPRERLMREAGR